VAAAPWSPKNNHLRVTVLKEGGHIAEILDKPSGANPLWISSWPSIEPSSMIQADIPSMGPALRLNCSPASWATIFASTFSAGLQPQKPSQV